MNVFVYYIDDTNGKLLSPYVFIVILLFYFSFDKLQVCHTGIKYNIVIDYYTLKGKLHNSG